ncbi:hypothetical protein GGS23DRAFT_461449 [Durotheca rogersii]|uniref:uncharacterized protein n=1 Tax=Durotheca rogersii TaxID=419775 RepID=UPI00221E8A2A|nr:uncharacterized protein GGS23DRAFT_461449 [Durotheca rogersii]KAI5864742.1 hypothetical protein GGS23DRAFT_461449 [Durotheca rogersii]
MPRSEIAPLISTRGAQTITISTDGRRRARARFATGMFWALACLYGAAAVGLGAFGAHGLKKTVSDPARLANWATAAHYQLVHSVALLVASRREAPTPNPVAGTLFLAGMTMFSGSLYALVLDPARFRFLGPVTPLGGLCLIGGWITLAFQ